MRFSTYISVIILLTVLSLNSCKKDVDPTALPYRFDVPVLLATHIISYDLREINFSIDLAVFKGDNSVNNIIEYTDLKDSSFHFENYTFNGTLVKFEKDSIKYIDTIPQNTFSTMILIDQSASPENFDSTDFYNQRFQAFNAFYKNLNGQDKVIFSTFSRTSNSHNVLKLLNNNFSSSWDENTAKSLLNITHQQTGTSGFFDALEQAINFIKDKDVENKSITLFVRNKDDGLSKLALDDIILLAKTNHIKINIIWLIKNTANSDITTLVKLTSKTGGFSVYMSKIYQSTTVFLGLTKLLKTQTKFYRIPVKLTIGYPNYFVDKTWKGMFLYYYTSPFFIWSYIPYYLEKP
jgi:hypothetical protein